MKLKDMMSSGLSSMAKVAKQSFTQVEQSSTSAQASINKTASAANNLASATANAAHRTVQQNKAAAGSYQALLTEIRKVEERVANSNNRGVITSGQRQLQVMRKLAEKHEGNISGARNSVLAGSFEAVKQKIKQVEDVIVKSNVPSRIRAAKKELKELQSQLKNHIANPESEGGFFGGLLKRFAPIAIGGAVVAGMGSLVTASAQQYMQVEANNKSYEILSGNKGVGQALAGELNQLKQDTILGPAVYKNAQTMMGFGIGAEKVIDNLKMLGEVSMGDAERLERLTLAFSQTQSAGKLMGQDLLQYINAGFNPLNELSKITGKSIGALRKEMEEGMISAEMVQQAFERATSKGGMFYGMLDQMGQTASGKMAAMHGKVAALQIAIGERLAPGMSAALDVTNKWIVRLKQWIEIPSAVRLQEQIDKIRTLQTEITSSNTSHQRQIEIFRELESINPNLVKGLSEQNIEYGKLASNISNVTEALRKKIFLETFNKNNAGVLGDYASAQNKYNENYAKTFALVAKAAPHIAQRTDLTLGQKQQLVQQYLTDKIASDPNNGYVTKRIDGQWIKTLSADADLLNQTKTAIKFSNKAAAEINLLQPKINEINKIKETLSGQIDAVIGVKGMSAANIENKEGAPSSPSASAEAEGKAVASGGPRVININGVKFMDTLQLHAANFKEGTDEIQRALEEMFIRILNSGAAVQ